MESRRRPSQLYSVLALVLGLALRLWFVAHSGRVAGDTLIYGDIAKNWMQHNVYGFSQSAAGPLPTLIRLPGYPLFLMLCFSIFGPERYPAVMYVQVVIDLLTCLLVAALARRLFGTRAAVVALWLAALCPFTAIYVAIPITETLSLFCIALALYTFARWQAADILWNPWLFALAAALAYAILLRPEQGLLAAAIFPAMLWFVRKRSRSPHAFAPIATAALCVILSPRPLDPPQLAHVPRHPAHRPAQRNRPR